MASDESSALLPVELDAVPETALWTLYQRAVEARRSDALLDDPKAVELVDRIDYPFAEKFGTSDLQAQMQAVRVACFDREIADFLAREPRGTVVCLGEGLETHYWRIDNGRAQWLTVDLPEMVALRERLLPPGPRQRYLAADATDLATWADQVDRGQEVLVTAQGLLMYLPPAQVRALIAGCAERFPGGSLVLDAVPRWFSRLTVRGKLRSRGYRVPPMPWGMDAGERGKLRTASPAVVGVRGVRPVGGRGIFGSLLPLALTVPPLAARLPSVTVLDFAERPGGEEPQQQANGRDAAHA
ncbi:class I SAM-dependent methyltransferase [Kitasatospora sp. RB6PN24]|uniref:class I SAM-dependent methyltransferase n=1 Tax=Kitasatospora humi TaxID=2893891 RepID=UPI001E531D75|nr:class I SAM-dependent methyltransferase [Kitasatospora humi]MCC9308185.1 class I SAM-dependent methyltransferase [Kitasatospora humi]